MMVRWHGRCGATAASTAAAASAPMRSTAGRAGARRRDHARLVGGRRSHRLVGGRRSQQVLLASPSAAASPLRLIQHKREAWWFYRYLSLVYDKIVNPGHWTEAMRDEALAPAKLSEGEGSLRVVDVGGGTGFSTLGIVAAGVAPERITLVDQSPHQLKKARGKAALEGCTIQEEDAEDLSFASDSFDRYVSCGSIEYWPDPQRGICEAYRVIKPGALACMVGPVHPTHPFSRMMADAWMLFPTEQEYIDWFTAAGFEDVKLTRIGPSWYRGCRKHGLIMGCSVTGIKPVGATGQSPLDLGPKAEAAAAEGGSGVTWSNAMRTLARVVLGSTAGLYYFLLPIYMWLKNLLLPKSISFK